VTYAQNRDDDSDVGPLLPGTFSFESAFFSAGNVPKVSISVAGQLALIATAFFTGAAIYINAAEQSARLNLDDKSLFRERRSAYKRGFVMQAPLALTGSLLGLLTWWQTNDWRWLVGAIVLVANRPYTLFAIMPINNQLNANRLGWCRLEEPHAARTMGQVTRRTFRARLRCNIPTHSFI
jgi:Domain of unknown function (DUF1772)